MDRSTQFKFLLVVFGIGTSSLHTITTTNNISYTLDGRRVLIQKGNQGATISIESNLADRCTEISNDIQTLSSELATLLNISGNNISIPISHPALLNFYINKVDANGMAVFNMDGNTALNNPLVQQIQVMVDANVIGEVQLVVINLSGTNITFAQGNMVGTCLSTVITGQSHTIWNFYQPTTISLTRNLMGALLAPYAFVTAYVNINGATAVQSLNINADVCNPPIIIPSCV